MCVDIHCEVRVLSITQNSSLPERLVVLHLLFPLFLLAVNATVHTVPFLVVVQ